MVRKVLVERTSRAADVLETLRTKDENITKQQTKLQITNQWLHLGMQPVGHLSSFSLVNRTWNVHFWGFLENVNNKVLIVLFQSFRVASQLTHNPLCFYHSRYCLSVRFSFCHPAALLYILQEVIKSTEQTLVFAATRHHVEYIKEVRVARSGCARQNCERRIIFSFVYTGATISKILFSQIKM